MPNMDNRPFGLWLKRVAGLAALAGTLVLTACGGGNGAPNNPYAPPGPAAVALSVLPSAITVYSGFPTTLSVTGGSAPYSAFSSNPTVLPVSQSVAGGTVLLLAGSVGLDTDVVVTVQDSAGTAVRAAVSVKPAPLLSSLITVTPNGDCSVPDSLCSGGTGTASVTVTGPAGGGIANRQVRFDVVSGSYAIQTPNPAAPLASTLTVVSDATGRAAVGLAVNVNAPTQIATIRATELTTGNQVTGNFLVQQVTDGSAVLSVIPTGNVTIKGPTATTCSVGASVAYYIYGGTPPYQVAATFPGVVSLSGVPVLANGGSFTATTNGSCFENMQYAISDATGRTIPGGSSPTLTNKVGDSAAGGGTAAPVAVSPLTVDLPSAPYCTGKTFTFVITGGKAPLNIALAPKSDTPIVSPNPVAASPGSFSVSGLLDATGTRTVYVGDASTPQLTATATINCH
jgi:hypothetical protein